MRFLFAMLLLSILSNLAFAQSKISGVVLDSATQQPLGRALISDGETSVIADKDGLFQMDVKRSGKNTISVQHVGCETKKYVFNLMSDTSIVFYLPHHLHTFEEALAIGHHDGKKSVSKVITINPRQLEHLAAVNLSDALANTNGINFLKTGGSIAKPMINGMHSNRVSVINDDSKQEGQQWGAEHAPEIDPLSTGKIEIIKGASLLRYGNDAIGGVIRLTPAHFEDSTYTKVRLISKAETNQLGGMLGLMVERHNEQRHFGQRFVINARRNGDARTPDYVLTNTGFGQLSGSHYLEFGERDNQFSIHTSAFLQEIGILASSHIGNLSDLNRALDSDTPLIVRPFTFDIAPPSQNIQHYSSKVKWVKHLDNSGEFHTSYTIQNNNRKEFDTHNSEEEAALNLNLLTQQLNLNFENRFDNGMEISLGSMGESQQNVYEGRYFIPNYNRTKAGFFLTSSFGSEANRIEGGIRYDWQGTGTFRYVNNEIVNEQFNFDGVSATIAGNSKISEDIELHVAAGTRFRSPDINELFSNGLHHGTAAIEKGDLNLTQERVYSLNASANYNHNRLRIQIEPYYYYFNNYIYLQPSGETQLTIRGAFPVFNYVQVNANYLGADIDVKYYIAHGWVAELKSSFVNVGDADNQKHIFGIPAPQLGLTLKHSFPKLLGISNGQVWVNASHVAKQNRIELDDFTPSPDAYTLVNAEIGGYLFESNSIYFKTGITNLLNSNYRDYMNRYRYYANDVGLNFYITINYNIN